MSVISKLMAEGVLSAGDRVCYTHPTDLREHVGRLDSQGRIVYWPDPAADGPLVFNCAGDFLRHCARLASSPSGHHYRQLTIGGIPWPHLVRTVRQQTGLVDGITQGTYNATDIRTTSAAEDRRPESAAPTLSQVLPTPRVRPSHALAEARMGDPFDQQRRKGDGSDEEEEEEEEELGSNSLTLAQGEEPPAETTLAVMGEEEEEEGEAEQGWPAAPATDRSSAENNSAPTTVRSTAACSAASQSSVASRALEDIDELVHLLSALRRSGRADLVALIVARTSALSSGHQWRPE